ncbi:MAG: thioredoxin reductase, partial [Solirubrobacterales bacterium]|nr:thioredoxin reductase [Solirubrobacterales bacterium]
MTDSAATPPDRTPVIQTESDVAFPRLDEAQVATMASTGRTEQVAAGEVLFSPGDLDNDLILVLSGCVEILDDADTPEERVLVTYGPRQFIGELNLITAEPTLLTARVTAPSEVVFVSREALR